MQTRPENFVAAEKGSEFQDRITIALDREAYTRILKTDIPSDQFTGLKEIVKRTESPTEAVNPSSHFRKHFIREPFGSQDYPDLLILDGDRAISVEIKFSTGRSSGHPMWNGGLPRPSGIYVFGSYGRQDVTFFRGCDVVSSRDIRKLRGFFERQKTEEADFNAREMTEQRYGFTTYVRRSFEQKKKHNPGAIVDFFKNPDRQDLEDAVLSHLRGV